MPRFVIGLVFVVEVMLFANPSTLSTKALDLSASYNYSDTLPDELMQSAFLTVPIGSKVSADLGLRLTEYWVGISTIEYKGELGYSPFSWLQLFFRLSNLFSPPYGFAHTDALLGIQIRLEPFSGFQLYGKVGLHDKLVSLNPRFLFVLTPSYVDQDVAVAAGMEFPFFFKMRGLAEISNLDRLRAFNLNNPFVNLQLFWPGGADTEMFAQARYRILLGFGRLDEFQTTVGMRQKL